MHASLLIAFALGALAGGAACWVALRNAASLGRMTLDFAHATREQSERTQALEREHWRHERAELLLRAQHERAELITRCMDPSLVAALTPAPIDPDTAPVKLHVSEDDEVRRSEAYAAIEAELAAREGALT